MLMPILFRALDVGILRAAVPKPDGNVDQNQLRRLRDGSQLFRSFADSEFMSPGRIKTDPEPTRATSINTNEVQLLRQPSIVPCLLR